MPEWMSSDWFRVVASLSIAFFLLPWMMGNRKRGMNWQIALLAVAISVVVGLLFFFKDP